MTDPYAAAREAATGIFHVALADDQSPGAALRAALDAFLGALRDTGHLAGPDHYHEAGGATEAAQWLADVSHHPRYAGDLWASLLAQDHSVEHAAAAALRRYPGDPSMARSITGARDLLLRHIRQEATRG